MIYTLRVDSYSQVVDIGFIIISAHELNVNGGRECPLMHFITKIYKNVDDCVGFMVRVYYDYTIWSVYV